MIGLRLPVAASKLTGRALGSRIIQASIVRGSANLAAEEELSVEVSDARVIVDLNERNLRNTALASGAIFTASTLFFMRRVQYADRLFAISNLFEAIAGNLNLVNSSISSIKSFATDLDGGILRGQTLLRSIQMQEGFIRGALDELDLIVELIEALNDPTTPASKIDELGERLRIITVGNRTVGQEVIQAHALLDNTKLPEELLGAVDSTLGNDAVGLKLVVDDMRQQIDDFSKLTRTTLEPLVDATQQQFEDIQKAVLRGDMEVMKVRPVDRQIAQAADDLVATSRTIVDEAKELSKVSTIAKETAGGKNLLSKGAKWLGRGLGKLLLVDTVIWGITGGIDLGLNLFLPEEEQGIFADFVGGWSPVGELVDLGIGAVVPDFDPEAIGGIIIAAANNDTLQGVLGTVLDFIVEDIRVEVDIPLAFEQDAEIEQQVKLPLPTIEPEDILVGAYIAIVAKLVFTYWLTPAAKRLLTYL